MSHSLLVVLEYEDPRNIGADKPAANLPILKRLQEKKTKVLNNKCCEMVS